MKNPKISNKNIYDTLICGNIQQLLRLYSKSSEIENKMEIFIPYLYVLSHCKSDFKELLYQSSLPNVKVLLSTVISYDDISNDTKELSQLETFIENEIQIRKKLSHLDITKKDTFIDQIDNPRSTFENGQPLVKLKLILSDLIGLIDYYDRLTQSINGNSSTVSQIPYEPMFLDTFIYYNEISVIIILIYRWFIKVLDQKKIIVSLMMLNQSPGLLIKSLLANNPNQYKEILDLILGSLNVAYADTLRKIILEICDLSQYSCRYIRRNLFQRQILPELVFTITSAYIHDEIELLGSIISNRSDSKWIKDYLSQSAQFNRDLSSFNEIRDSLMTSLENISNNNADPDEPFTIKSILRLYCALNGLLGLKINQQEITICLALIDKPNFKFFSKLYLCFLLTCEGLVKIAQPKKVVESLQHLSKNGDCDELLLLISIYFHTHQLPNIVTIVKNILGFKPSIHTESLNQIGEIITKEIFTEPLVSSKTSILPIKENLNNNDNFISIQCIYHLLSERIFEKYEIDVGEWICNQILKSTTPIHYLLPSCVDQLVKNIIEPTIVPISSSTIGQQQQQQQQSFYMKRIPESFILAAIKSPPSSNRELVQLMAVYLALRYNDSVLKYKTDHKGKLLNSTIENTQVKEYSCEFLSKLPIQGSLSLIFSKKSEYFYIIPPFLYLISSQFPQFFNIGLLLLEEESNSNELIERFVPQFYFNNVEVNIQYIIQLIKNTKQQPTGVLLLLKYLNYLSTEELCDYSLPLVEHLLPILIRERFNMVAVESLISPFTEIWSRVFQSQQAELALKTINILISLSLDDDQQTDEMSSPLVTNNYSQMDIMTDPLLVFRSHKSVFLCPPLLKILIQILYFFMVSSKKNLQNLIQVSNNQTKQEEYTTLILTQESSIIQILLEICVIDRISLKSIYNQNDKDSCDLGDIEEIKCHICTFIHQIFIEKPLIIKLIHFQGYLPQLLPITVTHIPSMHICFEFLPELLNQPSLEKQIFSIHLLSYLCEKYPIPKSLKICKISINRIVMNLQSNSPTTEKENFIQHILPSIIRITSVFPMLAEDYFQILLEQLPITKNSFIFQQPFKPNQTQNWRQYTLNKEDKLLSKFEQDIHNTIQIIIKNISK
ncbi:integrator complex subunit 2 [Tieghemostelium lacteum]|uniref:Integrator complex subunit 2 n=1 Tax=Tieghemostelium lacteum TaxID=361077 RepID=A0A151ZRZ1_TIELA|nr:integrator complex subunit 2 [Tieghemostelium lacteum]|eukprot:KYQ96763.1 integrator complex subunit 2 [Tieghemostelium lacteum]